MVCAVGLVGGILLLLGVWQLVSAYRERVDLNTPFCRRCAYNLTGLGSARCPECGVTLTREMIRHGRRAAPRGRIRSGYILSGIGVMLWVSGSLPAVQNFRLEQIKPTDTLLKEIESDVQATSWRALSELGRRAKLGKLEDGELEQLADFVTDAVLDGGTYDYGWALGDVLAGLAACNALPVDLLQRYGEARYEITAQTRPGICAGSRSALRVTLKESRPDAWSHLRAATISDVRVGQRAVAYECDRSWPQYGGSDGMHYIDCTFSPRRIGTQRLKADLTIDFGFGYLNLPSCVLTAETEIEVLPAEACDDVALVNGSELDASVRAAVHVPGASACGSSGRCLRIRVEGSAVPVDCAFQVLAIIAGREIPRGTVVIRKPDQHDWLDCACTAVDVDVPDRIDVILRTDPDLARRTLDIVEIWEGELYFSDVGVTRNE